MVRGEKRSEFSYPQAAKLIPWGEAMTSWGEAMRLRFFPWGEAIENY